MRRDWLRIILNNAGRYGVDPRAAAAVSMMEGLSGRVGDNGTSFGPFQLHIGGAMPKKYWSNPAAARRFAESPAGINYALQQMAAAGARGLRGRAAIEAIVHKFERPREDLRAGEIAGAWDRYGGIRMPVGGGMPAPMGNPVGPVPNLAASLGGGQPAGDDMRMQLLAALRQKTQAYLSNQQAPSLATLLPQLAQTFAPASPVSAIPRLPGSLGRPMPAAAPRSQGSFVMPLRTSMGGNSEFGVRDAEGAPSARGGRYHAGKDWFAPAGAPVFAPWNGKIVEVKASRGNSGQVFGGTVKIQAPNGRVFVARHVDPRGVKVGQRVRAGQAVAGVAPWTGGNPHAHIEVWKTLAGGYTYENMIDPVALFGARRRRNRRR